MEIKKLNFTKITLTPVKILLLVGLSIVLTAGIVHATATFNENVVINGRLDVNNGNFKFVRTDNVQTSLTLINPDKQTQLKFNDPDDDRSYSMRLTPGPTPRLDFFDFSGPNPVVRNDLSIKTDTGKVGIGTNNPQEQLDVNGNIFLSGANAKILSNGDICIGAC